MGTFGISGKFFCILIWLQGTIDTWIEIYQKHLMLDLAFLTGSISSMQRSSYIFMNLGRVSMQQNNIISCSFAMPFRKQQQQQQQLLCRPGNHGSRQVLEEAASMAQPLTFPSGYIIEFVQCSCTESRFSLHGVLARLAWRFVLVLWCSVACRILRRRRESCCHGSRTWNGGNRFSRTPFHSYLILSDHFHNQLESFRCHVFILIGIELFLRVDFVNQVLKSAGFSAGY